ncbi:MAG: hypothetical protein LUD77_06010 [Clostridiales bacterium]|nr:hypothetical protein [Clostridiales bacterium]
MNIFVTLFAVFVIIIFFALAVKKGSQNREEISKIEKAERQAAGISEDEEENETGEKQSGLIGSVNSIKNTAGRTLKQFGIIIMIAGTIISLCLAKTETEDLKYGFSFLIFFTYLFMYCAAGFFFIGMGEIVRLLDNINKKLRNR